MIPKVVFVGGKGGVGKSSISSAIATSKAESGAKTLLISTDPAHNLGDIFGVSFSNKVITLQNGLDVLELDPAKEAREYVAKVAKQARGFVGAGSYAQLDEYFSRVAASSSALEAALFEKLSSILFNEQDNYSHIIIDTAPTGHSLRLFFMPSQLRSWAKNLLSLQERGGMAETALGHLNRAKDNRFSDPDGFLRANLIEILDERQRRYSAFANLLKDKNRCAIVLVLNANKLALNETQRAIKALEQKELSPYAIVLNKLLPHSSEDEFLQARISQENEYVKQSDMAFKAYKYVKMPLLKSDIINLQTLKNFGDELLNKLSQN